MHTFEELRFGMDRNFWKCFKNVPQILERRWEIKQKLKTHLKRIVERKYPFKVQILAAKKWLMSCLWTPQQHVFYFRSQKWVLWCGTSPKQTGLKSVSHCYKHLLSRTIWCHFVECDLLLCYEPISDQKNVQDIIIEKKSVWL